MIAASKRAGPVAGALLALIFAALLVPVATCELWLGRLLSPERAAHVIGLHAREPLGLAGTLGLGVSFGLIGLLLTAYMRHSHRGRLLRRQATLLGTFVLFAVAAKAALLLTPLSWFALPTGAVALGATLLVDRYAGFATAVALGFVASALLPFDASVAIVLGAQALGTVLGFSAPKRRSSFFLAGLAGGLAAAAAYLATSYLYGSQLPGAELADPFRSSLFASFLGGLVSGPLALFVRAQVEGLGGEIPRARLIELADLENPMLKKIAANAPGTWQHSLAMANMAEMAANAIGANALLVRVGAYYHDLGKSLQPQYYIENLAGGQPSPHDELAPEMSADAIFAHVTEGVRLARASGLPAAIIDFMHMHHGDGVLEYFWNKCQEQGNPDGLTIEAFRYPGVKPQSRETAILAICDAVEAASRTLKRPEERAIEQLVQRIVYGKLHLGQLDESGLTVAELKKLANTLVANLKHAHHDRIEYPWQKEERAAEQARALAAIPIARPARAVETSGRFVLDSADAPRPAGRTNEMQIIELTSKKKN